MFTSMKRKKTGTFRPKLKKVTRKLVMLGGKNGINFEGKT